MTDDATIRAVLRDLGRSGTFGTPENHLRVWRDDLTAHGIDFEDAAGWVEAHGGHVERKKRRRTQVGGPNYGKVDLYVSLIVPEDALRD